MFSLTGACASLLSVVIPARRSEVALRALSLSKLNALAAPGERDGVRYALPYRQGEVRALVWELKYHQDKKALDLAGRVLGEEMMGILSEEFGEALLIPVPMHQARRRARGQNQTELLCEATLKICGHRLCVSYEPKLLSRKMPGAPQQTLRRSERLESAKYTMAAGAGVRGRICIVLDDVVTTGATLREARRALLEAGAKRVHSLALAG